MIDAIRELRGPAGTGAVIAPRGQPQPPPPKEPEEIEGEQAELVAVVAEEYEHQLQQVQEEAQQRVERLISDLIQAQLELDFERNYQWIYGSQLRALRALRAAGGQLPREAVEPIFEDVRPLLPPGTTFDVWVGYLLRQTYSPHS